MPISPKKKKLYPYYWKELSLFIRFVRAKNKCELCGAENYKPHPITGSKVILTVMHLDHNQRHNWDSNLKAGCQKCHNSWDSKFRTKNRRKKL